MPYMGNLQRADVFLLMINPGVGWEDYEDAGNDRFEQALQENIAGNRKTCLAWDTKGVGLTVGPATTVIKCWGQQFGIIPACLRASRHG